MITITHSQSQTLKYIKDYIEENGITPTYEVAAEAMGVWPNAIVSHVSRLIDKGLMERLKDRKGAYRLKKGVKYQVEAPLKVKGFKRAGRG